MTRYIVLRLLHGVIVIIIVSILVFLMMRLLPGDPVLLYLDRAAIVNADPATLEHLRAEFGLDKSLVEQYFLWVNNIFLDIYKNIYLQPHKTALPYNRVPRYIVSLYQLGCGHYGRYNLCFEERALAGHHCYLINEHRRQRPDFLAGDFADILIWRRPQVAADLWFHVAFHGFLVKHQADYYAGGLLECSIDFVRYSSNTLKHSRNCQE
jgi:hypothetical protein